MNESREKRRVFISYAREDQATAEKIHQNLSDAGFDPWMDVHDIVSGRDWLQSITHAIKGSDYFIVCLSSNSILKPGVLQEELNIALEICKKIPDPDIFLIPVRLEDCEIPKRISKYQWVDLFAEDGWVRLLRALHQKRKPSHKLVWGLSVLGLGLLISLVFLFRNALFMKVETDEPLVNKICDSTSYDVPVKVGIAKPTGYCLPDYQDALEQEWDSGIAEITKLDTLVLSGFEARSLSGFDLVVWGSCEGDLTLNFELTTSRSPAEMYEPEGLQVTGGLDEIAGVGTALIYYQKGDYEEAARQFESLESTASSPEQVLFWANSLLFDGRYDEAMTALKENALDSLPGPAYNNLGVARFNLDKLLGEAVPTQTGMFEFDQAIELAEEQGNNKLKIIAYTNRSTLYRQGNNWKNALADCEAAIPLDSRSALPFLCRARYYFARYSNPQDELPLEPIDSDLARAESNQSQMPLVHYFRGLWLEKNKRYDESLVSYHQYLDLMKNQACLQTDRNYMLDATSSIKKYGE